MGFELEAIEIRVYEDCIYLSYPIWTENEDEATNVKLREALTSMPLPRNFEFDRDGMLLEYRVDVGDEGFVCDIGWLAEQLQKIIDYAESLMASR